MSRFVRLMMLMVLCLTGTAVPTVAAQPVPETFYVATNGSDTNPGTLDLPWATLSKAVDTATAGQTVRFRAGTYRAYKRFTRSGTATAPITFEAYPGETPVFDGSNVASDPPNAWSQLALFEVHASNLVFRGLEFKNAASHAIYCGEGTHHNIIDRCHIHNGYLVGILCYRCSQHTISNCVIHDVYDHDVGGIGGGGNADGIGTPAGNAPAPTHGFHTIINNVVYNCSDDGIDTWTSSGNTLRNNVSFHNGYGNEGNGGALPGTWGQPAGNGMGFKLGGGFNAGRNTVINNVAHANRHSGYDCNGGIGNVLYNNTSYANLDSGFGQLEAATVVMNNLAFANARATQGTPGTSKRNSWNLGIADPLFASVDPASPLFLRLSERSPAINMGADLSAAGVRDDRVGTPRPQGRRFDLGAYEFESALNDHRIDR